jgi:hypothetical protein
MVRGSEGPKSTLCELSAIDLPALRNRPQQSPIYDAGRDPPGVDALQMNARREALQFWDARRAGTSEGREAPALDS